MLCAAADRPARLASWRERRGAGAADRQLAAGDRRRADQLGDRIGRGSHRQRAQRAFRPRQRSRLGEPLELVKTAADKAIQILRDPKLKAPDKKKERIERLKEAINPIFDYEEMARRSLGQHWRRRTPAEQEEFTQLFRAFLEKIYSDKVDLYEGE